MSEEGKKSLAGPGEPAPEGLVSGTPGKGKPAGASRPRIMKRIASELMRQFPLIGEDPVQFKKQGVYHLKRNPPPQPGRPMESAITRAIELHKVGHLWKHIYPQRIANHSGLPPAERGVAQDNLRAACRSRRNAAKRRKRQGTCTSESNT